MSAEILRRAAASMRERAEPADMLRPGPWVVAPNGVTAGVWSDPKARLAAESDFESVAEHIASWHPVVALAVADWLDMEALGIESGNWRPCADAALVAARAYLGESA